MQKRTVLITSLLVLSLILCFCGCSKSTACVTINDALTETIVDIPSGFTVSQAIQEAEIAIGEKDEVLPSPDTELKDGDKITISRYALVNVEYEGVSKSVELTGGKVFQAVEKSGLRPNGNYAVNYDADTYLEDGMDIHITKLINVNIAADGETKNIESPVCTVEEFLKNQGIYLGKNDLVSPELNVTMNSDTEIIIKRVSIKTITVTEPIDYKTVTKNSSKLNKGETKVYQQGEKGEKKVKYKITYIDGAEKTKEVLEETVIKEPVDKIVIKGTKGSGETTTKKGKYIVSKQRVDDCDGSGHGYFVISWSDGSTTYEEY